MRNASVITIVIVLAMAVTSAIIIAFAYLVTTAGATGPAPESSGRIDESRTRADLIGVLLDIYKVHKGRYPHSLDSIELDLGVKLDLPTVAKWEYRPSSDGAGYIIKICNPLYSECYPPYTLYADGTWDVDV